MKSPIRRGCLFGRRRRTGPARTTETRSAETQGWPADAEPTHAISAGWPFGAAATRPLALAAAPSRSAQRRRLSHGRRHGLEFMIDDAPRFVRASSRRRLLQIASKTGFAQYNYFGMPGNLDQPILQQLARQFQVGLQHSFAPDDYGFLLANVVGEV